MPKIVRARLFLGIVVLSITALLAGACTSQLGQHLVVSYAATPGAVSLNLDTAGVSLPLDTAIPCGLIINELVTNSLKHAFPQGRTGEILVTLLPEEYDRLALVVGDDGIGFPEDLDFRQIASVGMQLVVNLTEQLQGTVELNREKGTEWRILFPHP